MTRRRRKFLSWYTDPQPERYAENQRHHLESRSGDRKRGRLLRGLLGDANRANAPARVLSAVLPRVYCLFRRVCPCGGAWVSEHARPVDSPRPDAEEAAERAPRGSGPPGASGSEGWGAGGAAGGRRDCACGAWDLGEFALPARDRRWLWRGLLLAMTRAIGKRPAGGRDGGLHLARGRHDGPLCGPGGDGMRRRSRGLNALRLNRTARGVLDRRHWQRGVPDDAARNRKARHGPRLAEDRRALLRRHAHGRHVPTDESVGRHEDVLRLSNDDRAPE